MPLLICKHVTFYSTGDERAFFEFAKRIKGVRKINGVGEQIQIHVVSRLSDASLLDVLALFHRYKIEMSQLSRFLTAKNADWFRDKTKFWFKKVF
jgi:hypothetical protein